MRERRHEERRHYPRVMVSCTPVNGPIAATAPTLARKVVDISTGGARLVVPDSWKEGDPLLLRLTDSKSNHSIRVAAEIRWKVPMPNVNNPEKLYCIGVRFMRSRGILELLRTA